MSRIVITAPAKQDFLDISSFITLSQTSLTDHVFSRFSTDFSY